MGPAGLSPITYGSASVLGGVVMAQCGPARLSLDMNATDPAPIEIATDHRCLIGGIVDKLAARAAAGDRGETLAEAASGGLRKLDQTRFDACCAPAYLALAHKRFTREIQVPIARAGGIEARVLLWPIGAEDGEHPHCEGWAAIMAVRGQLSVCEERGGERMRQRRMALLSPEVLEPEDDVTHYIFNHGDDVGLTIHLFGT